MYRTGSKIESIFLVRPASKLILSSILSPIAYWDKINISPLFAPAEPTDLLRCKRESFLATDCTRFDRI